MSEEDEDNCGHPCPPEDACDVCAFYWERMHLQGLWDRERQRWTDRGWMEIVK